MPKPSTSSKPLQQRGRSLAHQLMDSLSNQVREGKFAAGEKLPTEAEIVAEYRVSRTVVREAISKLQTSGLVETRHGVGTFVVGVGDPGAFQISADQVQTLQDVIAVLELRIGVETEAAALAARRRKKDNLLKMKSALDAFDAAIKKGRDAVGPDFQFHLEIAKATQNPHYVELLNTLGTKIIPRARLDSSTTLSEARRQYLRLVNSEHLRIYEAIVAQDAQVAKAAMHMHLANSCERRRQASVA